MNTEWKSILNTLSKTSHIDPEIIDLISVIEICKYCADGYSNLTIAEKCDYAVADVVPILVKYLSTYGWPKTLGISPYLQYKKAIGERNAFITIFMDADPMLDISTANLAYDICKRYAKIEEKINEHYRSECP